MMVGLVAQVNRNDVVGTIVNRDDGLLTQVNRDDVDAMMQRLPLVNPYSISVGEGLGQHDTKSLMKCCETLSFLVRDVAHVTPHNFETCVHCIRVFVEASLNGGWLRAIVLFSVANLL